VRAKVNRHNFFSGPRENTLWSSALKELGPEKFQKKRRLVSRLHMNDLIQTNLLGDSHTAFIRQVTNYLDTLERGIALTMQRKTEAWSARNSGRAQEGHRRSIQAPPTQVSGIGLLGMFGPGTRWLSGICWVLDPIDSVSDERHRGSTRCETTRGGEKASRYP